MKQFRKILCLGILFLFVCTLQLAAQKCKFDYNKTDPFSGEATKGNTVGITSYFGQVIEKMGFSKVGETYSLRIEIRYSGNSREIIQKGDKMNIKLSNGEAITLTAQNDFLPLAYASEGGVVTTYKANYDIDAATVKQMGQNPPTFIRMSIGSIVYEKTVSGKIGKNISQAATCILQ